MRAERVRLEFLELPRSLGLERQRRHGLGQSYGFALRAPFRHCPCRLSHPKQADPPSDRRDELILRQKCAGRAFLISSVRDRYIMTESSNPQCWF